MARTRNLELYNTTYSAEVAYSQRQAMTHRRKEEIITEKYELSQEEIEGLMNQI